MFVCLKVEKVFDIGRFCCFLYQYYRWSTPPQADGVSLKASPPKRCYFAVILLLTHDASVGEFP